MRVGALIFGVALLLLAIANAEVIEIVSDFGTDIKDPIPPVGKEKWDRYKKWLEDSGVWDFSACDVVWLPDYKGYGVKAKRVIPKGENLMKVPKSFFVTESNIMQTPDFAQFQGFQWPDYVSSIATYFMVEYLKGEQSYYKPWFDIMSFDFGGSFLWSEEETQELQKSYLRGHDPNRLLSTRGFLYLEEKLYKPYRSTGLFPENFFTLENYKKFYALTVTRAFGSLSKPQNNNQQGMACTALPHSDMWNHDFKGNGFSFPKDEYFTLIIVKDIQPGEEITANYGSFDSGHFLQLYGFLPENDPYDGAYLSLQMNANAWPLALLFRPYIDPLFGAKSTDNEYHIDTFFGTSSPNADLLTIGRIQSLGFKDVNTGSLKVLVEKKAFSISNELQAIRNSINFLHSITTKEFWGTTFEEDVELLKNPNLPYRKKVAIQRRAYEKLVFRTQIEILHLLWNKTLESGALFTGNLETNEDTIVTRIQ